MYVICPVNLDLCDAEWYFDLDDAKENRQTAETLKNHQSSRSHAILTFKISSVEESGGNVILYEAKERDDGSFNFNKLFSFCS